MENYKIIFRCGNMNLQEQISIIKFPLFTPMYNYCYGR